MAALCLSELNTLFDRRRTFELFGSGALRSHLEASPGIPGRHMGEMDESRVCLRAAECFARLGLLGYGLSEDEVSRPGSVLQHLISKQAPIIRKNGECRFVFGALGLLGGILISKGLASRCWSDLSNVDRVP